MVRLVLHVLLKDLETGLDYFFHFFGLAFPPAGLGLGLRVGLDQQVPEVAQEDVESVPVCDVLVYFGHLNEGSFT